MIRVILPSALRVVAGVQGEVEVEVSGEATLARVLDAVEAAHPSLRGTMRDQISGVRRPFIRFYTGQEDISHQPTDDPLPPAVATGAEPLAVVGAMAGG